MKKVGFGVVLVLLTGMLAPVAAGADDCVVAERLAHSGPLSTAPGPGIGGSTVYVDGVFLHTDYIYDDHGATGVNPGLVGDTSALPEGSYQYPLDEARYVNNAADIREIWITRQDDVLTVRVYLQTLAQADTTAVSIGFDVDDDHETPRAFPHGLGLSANGLDAVLTLTGAGARLAVGDAEPSLSVAPPPDLEENLLTGSVTLTELGATDADSLTVWAAAGLFDGENFVQVLPLPPNPLAPGGRQTPTDARAFDLAFHPGEGGADQWFDAMQAAAIASGDITAMAETLDLGGMAAGVDRPWEPLPGYYEGIHRSAFTLEPYHEGWTPTGSPGTGFQGRYQPYSLYIPPQVADGDPLALVIFFHGGTRNHTNLIGGANMQAQLGDALGAVMVAPLARRGNETDYAGDRLADSREVLADTHRRFDIDLDRRYLSGYSQGGNGVYRSMTFTADEWASAIIWAGQNPGAVPWLESSRWIRPILLHTPADELVPYTDSFTTHMRLDELGYEHELRTHGGEHEHQAVTDDYTQPAEWFAARTRDPAPPHVSFVRVPAEDAADYGLVFDDAYWLRDIITPELRGVAEVTSFALGKAIPTTEDVLVEETGPPSPYLRDGLAYVYPEQPPAAENRLEANLVAISFLTVDTVTAGLDRSQPIELSVTTDRPAALEFSGIQPGTMTLEGDGALVEGPCGVVVSYPEAGEHATQLVPAATIVQRLAGAERTATAGQVALATQRSAETVLVARADSYADALASAPLAGMIGAPLVLTSRDSLSPAAKAAILQLGTDEVLLLGGFSALRDTVELELQDLGIRTRRIAGDDRFATAAAIAEELGAVDGAVVAEGAHADPSRGWPDALAAGALAAAMGRPLLFVTADGVPDATVAALEGVEDVVVVGGSAAVSDAVLAELAGGGRAVRRVAGPTRYATAVAAAQEAMAAGADPAITWVATGRDFADGLTAGAAAALDRGVLLLVDGATPAASPETFDALAALSAAVRLLRLAGGPAAISADAEQRLADALVP